MTKPMSFAAPSQPSRPGRRASAGLDFTRIDEDVVRLAGCALDLAEEKNLSAVTAESCTGGLVAAVLSEAPGAGTHLQGGFVTYTKPQKTAVLDVPAALLATKGAVCNEVAQAMAEGALRHSPADVAVAVTGVAGPSADEDGNPVGRVCFAGLRRGAAAILVERQFGNIGPGAVRYRAVAEAIALLAAALALDPEPVTRNPVSPPAADNR